MLTTSDTPGLNIHELPTLTKDDVAEADRRADEKYAHVYPGPLRVGVNRFFEPCEVSVENGAATIIETDEGRQVWTLAIQSPGAYGIRLHLTEFDVSEGSAIAYSYGMSGVNCCLGQISWAAVKATGQMNFSDSEGSYVCTGTLLNDNDGDTIVPWFITAKHCLDTQEMVDTLEVVWHYETPSCDDEAGVPDWATLPRNVGGRHFRRYGENDMKFMRLAGNLPGGLGLAGWTEATSQGQYGVHHPHASRKRIVLVSDVMVGCGTFDATDYDSYDQDAGLIQGGSSGSGIFNRSGQLGGQLWGRCSATTDPDDMNCGNIDHFWAMYGEFDTSHDEIGWHLNIGGTMYVDPESDCLLPIATEGCPFWTIEQALGVARWRASHISRVPASAPAARTARFCPAISIAPTAYSTWTTR